MPLGAKTLDRVPAWESDSRLWATDYATSALSNQVTANYAYYTVLNSFQPKGEGEAVSTEDLVLAGALLTNSTAVSIDVAEDFEAMGGLINRLMARKEAAHAKRILGGFTAMLEARWPGALPARVWRTTYSSAASHPLLGQQLGMLARVCHSDGDLECAKAALTRAAEVEPRNPKHTQMLQSL